MALLCRAIKDGLALALVFILDGSREMREGGLHLVHGHQLVTVLVIQLAKSAPLKIGDGRRGWEGHAGLIMLVLRNVRKQHARAGLQWAFKSLSQALGKPA